MPSLLAEARAHLAKSYDGHRIEFSCYIVICVVVTRGIAKGARVCVQPVIWSHIGFINK